MRYLRTAVVSGAALGLLTFLAAGCSRDVPAPRVEPAVQFFVSPDSVLKDMPFSEAVQVGSLLLVSGEIGALPGTMTLAPGGLVPEARQALANIRGILERHGATLRDVVKCTVLLADIKDWAQFNEVYKGYFSPPYPARSAFGTTGLALGARTEIQCVAVVPGQ